MDHRPMYAPKSSITIASLILLAVSPHAHAQPEDQSPGSQQQVENARALLPRVGTDQNPVMPTTPKVSVAVQPGLTQGQDWLKDLHETLEEPTEPSTLAEGAFVLNRLGAILPGPNGLLIFVPDKATRLPGEGPVLLMPCQTLQQLETEWSGQSVEVSGEIFTYHNRNQFLISAYRIGSSEPVQTQPDPDPTKKVYDTDTDDPSSLEDDPDVRDLLDELEFNVEPTDHPRDTAHQTLTAPNQTARRSQVTQATTIGGLDEGTLILRRPSRMIRASTGAWTIIFDNDNPDSSDATELIVEPCQMLMRMENIAMDTGDAGQLLVSGRVYTYKGDHYILPTLMQRLRPQELNSMQ